MTAVLMQFENVLRRYARRIEQYPEWLVAAIGLLLVAFVLFARVLLRPSLMVIGSDFTQFYFWEYFAREEMAAGQLPQWNPYFLAGYPLLANPQTRTFYPLLWLTRLFPLDYSFGVYLMLHVWVAGLGMYGLSRAQGLGRVAACISALSFMMGGTLATHIEGGHLEWVSTLAWIPWVISGWQKTLFTPGLRTPVLAGVVSAMLFLAGGPRVLVCVLVMLACLGAVWLLGTALRRDWHGITTAAARLTLGGLVAGGLTAPQLLPGLELAALSSRAGGNPVSCSSLFSLDLNDLASFTLARLPFDPFLAWERNGYVGGLALVFAVVGLLLIRKSEWARLNIVIGATGLLIAFGPALPVYEFLHDWLPGFASIRQPFTLIVLPGFALAALAGAGAHWLSAERQGVTPLVALTGVLAVLAIAADWMLYQASATTLSGAGAWVRFLINLNSPRYLAAIGVLALFGNPKLRFLVSLACIGLLSLDLGLFASAHIPVSPGSTMIARPLEMPQVNAAEARLATFPYMHSVSTTYTHTANANGYSPIIVEAYNSFARGTNPAPQCSDFEHPEIRLDDTQFFRLLSVRYLTDIANNTTREMTDYSPRVIWTERALPVESSIEAITQVRSQEAYDPSQGIYVEGLALNGAGQSADDGEGKVWLADYQTQSVAIEVDAPRAGWVYLNDLWYPGWSATVNGESQPVYRANGTFRAVSVPAGHSVMRMTFQSTYLNLGLIIFVITASGLMALAAFTAIRSRGRPATPRAPANSE